MCLQANIWFKEASIREYWVSGHTYRLSEILHGCQSPDQPGLQWEDIREDKAQLVSDGRRQEPGLWAQVALQWHRLRRHFKPRWQIFCRSCHSGRSTLKLTCRLSLSLLNPNWATDNFITVKTLPWQSTILYNWKNGGLRNKMRERIIWKSQTCVEISLKYPCADANWTTWL